MLTNGCFVDGKIYDNLVKNQVWTSVSIDGPEEINDQLRGKGSYRKALAAIEATSRDALTELRRMLGVLRREDGVPAALAPAPGIAALDHLVEQVRLAGYTVNLDTAAVAARALSPTVELSIYRIAQEALTNVVKHAGAATVNIEIRDEPSALVLEVSDDGRGADAAADPAQRDGCAAYVLQQGGWRVAPA